MPQFLAQKQALAIRAREAAHAATEGLHAYLHDTNTELGVLRSLKPASGSELDSGSEVCAQAEAAACRMAS